MSSREKILNKLKLYANQDNIEVNPPSPPLFSSDNINTNLTEKFIYNLNLVSAEIFTFKENLELEEIIQNLKTHYNLEKILADSKIQKFTQNQNLPLSFIDIDSDIKDKLKNEKCFFEYCDLACGDTGSIYFFNRKYNSNYQSLYPEIHIVLLEEKNILTYSECVKQVKNLTKKNQNIVAITGPSRTADIEKMLVLGVHGPKKLIIIIKLMELQ